MANVEILLQPDRVPDRVPGTDAEIRRTGRLILVLRRFSRHVGADIGIGVFVLLVLFALVGPHIGRWSYDDPDFLSLSSPPSADHWFGTDLAGSDLFALVARGLGKSLLIGCLSSLATTLIAALVGTTIAFFEGWVERVGMWVLDMLLVVPSFLLIAMLVQASSGSTGWLWLTLGLTAFGWIGYARTLRTLALSLREHDYVTAAKFMGVPSFTIIARHLIPNLSSILIINTVLGIVGAVNSETALSFLGLGIKPPDTSLGTILQEGAGTVLTAPWVLLIPSLFLVALTFSVQLIGDGLRDALDPNSSSGGKA